MKKLVSALLAVVMSLSLCCVPAFAANTVDTEYMIFTGNVNYYWTEYRSKQDNSSVYINFQHTNVETPTWTVTMIGGRQNPPTPGDYGTNCNWGASPKIISVGSRYFVLNSVYENGFPWVRFSGEPTNAASLPTQTGQMWGLWSPDSVYESGVTTISMENTVEIDGVEYNII